MVYHQHQGWEKIFFGIARGEPTERSLRSFLLAESLFELLDKEIAAEDLSIIDLEFNEDLSAFTFTIDVG